MPKTVAKPLTRAAVERLRYRTEGPKIQRLWDTAVPGLGAEVYASGRKSWIFRYRLGERQTIMTLGAVAELGLEQARETAVLYKVKLREGTDPKAAREAPDGALSVRQLWERYSATPYYLSRSQDFRNGMTSTMRAHVLPAWGHLPLPALKRKMISDVVDALIADGREGAARGVLNRLRILFNYALQKELIEASPADHIKPQFTTTGRRDAWLETDEELCAAWFIDAPIQVRLMVRWLLLTGCRRDEARTATHGQITDGVWRVEETKNSHPLVLPMMPAMSAIVAESAATFGATAWLFPATTSNFKALPRASFDWSLRQATEGRWSAHVLRHSVESHLRELGVGEEARDAVLNHVRKGTGSRYGHGDQLAIKREALETWHRKLDAVLTTA